MQLYKEEYCADEEQWHNGNNYHATKGGFDMMKGQYSPPKAAGHCSPPNSGGLFGHGGMHGYGGGHDLKKHGAEAYSTQYSQKYYEEEKRHDAYSGAGGYAGKHHQVNMKANKFPGSTPLVGVTGDGYGGHQGGMGGGYGGPAGGMGGGYGEGYGAGGYGGGYGASYGGGYGSGHHASGGYGSGGYGSHVGGGYGGTGHHGAHMGAGGNHCEKPTWSFKGIRD